MKLGEQAFAKLKGANPFPDTSPYVPTPAEASLFLRITGEETADDLTPTKHVQRRTSERRRSLAVAGSLVAIGATIAVVLVASSDRTQPADSAGQTTSLAPAEIIIDEPVELAEVRDALNAGDGAAAAAVLGEDGSCDRFFTIGVESCADWYGFLAGIGTTAIAADCSLEGQAGEVRCHWTVASDAHRALGIESVSWLFSGIALDGWSTTFPDHNLFTGIIGEAALDTDFWAFITKELDRKAAANTGTTALPSIRVSATLNADFASVVLDAARSFGES